MKNPSVKGILVLLLISATLLAAGGKLDPIMGFLGGNKLQQENEAYLENSWDKAIKGFGVMSLLKASLDIIEGSTVGANLGVTAQVEIGDVAQPAYDYVDLAWRTLLVGSVALLGIRYLLQAATLLDATLLAFVFFLATLLLLATWCRPKGHRVQGVLRDMLSIGIVCCLAVYYLLPLSVWGASRLSQTITAPSLEEATRGFEQAKQSLFPESEEMDVGWGRSFKGLQGKISDIATQLKEKSTDFVTWTVKLIAGYIFDCIVFPGALFMLLLWMTRGVLHYVSHKSFQRSLREDFEHILKPRSGPTH